jgi:hypothetical protein
MAHHIFKKIMIMNYQSQLETTNYLSHLIPGRRLVLQQNVTSMLD